jgi:hypothetical protein
MNGRVTRAAGVLLVAALGSAGCATVHPWQRGRLSSPCMVFDSNGEKVAFDNHWLTAREASAGGFGVQSGGCGCK